MSISAFVFLAVRAAHVLLAAAWLGTAAFIYLFLSPALDEMGPSGAALMTIMGRRGFHPLIAKIPATSDAAARTALLTEIAATKRRMGVFGRVVLALQVVALVCMAVGHYV